jgi:hypothetical protein
LSTRALPMSGSGRVDFHSDYGTFFNPASRHFSGYPTT